MTVNEDAIKDIDTIESVVFAMKNAKIYKP
jgi:hypothetical protein